MTTTAAPSPSAVHQRHRDPVALVDYLDKGASLGAPEPCLTTGRRPWTYGSVQDICHRVAGALDRSGIRPGDKVAILSANDPIAFACVFGISRAGAVWCPVNPRNEAAENRDLLDLFGCRGLIFQAAFAPLVAKILPQLPGLATLVCLDSATNGATRTGALGAVPFGRWLAGAGPWQAEPPDEVVMLAGTGGTTGRPKGVMLTGHNIETMTAITLMSYPFRGRPRYLALAPLTHAAGVLCFPVLTLGGEIVIMPAPDLADFLALIRRHAITHTFLPPTLIYMLLGHPDLPPDGLPSLQCLWYGAAPMSATRLAEAIEKIGPVLGQLFGQTEAPMMISTLAPARPLPPRRLARHRTAAVGRPARPAGAGGGHGGGGPPARPRPSRARSSAAAPWSWPATTRTRRRPRRPAAHGWHHTGDIGYLDEQNYLFIVDRAKDVIITGGFNVYSAEVEQVLLAHPAIQDCAVVGLPDEKWGERVTAVVQPLPGRTVTAGRRARLRQGPAGQRQGAQAGRGLARPAALQGRQGPQGRHQVPPAAAGPNLTG